MKPGDWSYSVQWRVFAAVWATAALAAVLLAGELARRDAQAAVMRQARTAAALHGAVLKSELERQEAVPSVLAQDPDVRRLLEGAAPSDVEALNRKFETLSQEVRTAAIYALSADGTALAASNWRLPTSFVGSNYRFRPYYARAMRDGRAAFFALGTVSGRPGLYLARRIDGASGRPLGVIVAKVEFDALETQWRASGEPAYVTDAQGVVVITTVPAWRFRAATPLSLERRRALAQRQTAGPMLVDLPFRAPGEGIVRIGDDVPPGAYVHATDRSAGLEWTVHLLSPADLMMSRAVNAARGLALLSIALLAGLTGVLLRRRQRAAAEAVAAEAARVELEGRIEARTAELSDANRKLHREMDERRRLEKARQDLQDDLIQSSKLATLGQIAAGVAHEINQPVAAIRTHADSAALYLDRSDADAARRSLDRIAHLTARVGVITDELRAFSRKTGSAPVAVEVEAAIDGALLLVGARLREGGVTLERVAAPADTRVRAERNRLEQVMLNLLQNAAEAVAGVDAPHIALSVQVRARQVVIQISDNGPGLSDAVRDRLFTPFITDKPQGLGLGLVISRDIVAGFGGELSHVPSARGAVFRITLARVK